MSSLSKKIRAILDAAPKQNLLKSISFHDKMFGFFDSIRQLSKFSQPAFSTAFLM